MMRQKRNQEYENFDRAMRTLIQVPHEQIKAQLDAEKAEKGKKKRKAKPSASVRASGDKD